MFDAWRGVLFDRHDRVHVVEASDSATRENAKEVFTKGLGVSEISEVTLVRRRV